MGLGSNLKSKENRESWEGLFRKAILKEPFFAFTKPAENPIHWIQSTCDQQDACKGLKSASRHMNNSPSHPNSNTFDSNGWSANLLGWPFMPLSKVQMFKCEKCCLNFCSPLNHRRHLRVIHRRPMNGEKEESTSQRHELATFWDNLSPEEANNIVSNKNLVLEDLTGEKVSRALAHLLQQPSVFALPCSYVKAGAMLLELVRNKSSKLSITSSELFKILDGSSEKTFPSFGLSAMYRYVFEGDAGKVGLELKNLVASLGFLVEYNLVNALIISKDEEAFRCQTALVEEEEASRRKQVEIQDKKKFKKARQKKLREKDLKHSYLFTGQASVDHDDIDEENTLKFAAGNRSASDLQSLQVDNTHENLYDRLNHLEQELVLPTCDSFKVDHGKVEVTDDSPSLMDMANEDHKNESKMQMKSVKGQDAQESEMIQKQKTSINQNLSRTRAMPASKYRYALKQKKCIESATLMSMSKDLLTDCSLKDLLGTNMDIHDDGYTSQTTTKSRPYHLIKSMKKKYQSSRGMRHTIWARKLPASSTTDGEILSPRLQNRRNSNQDDQDTHIAIGVSNCDSDSSIMKPYPKNAPNSDNCPSLEMNGDEVCSHPGVSLVSTPETFPCAKDLSLNSVVIGSLSVPFPQPLFDLGLGGTSTLYEDVGEITREIEDGENRNVRNTVHATATEESLHALHENVAIQPSSHKDCERDGKYLKSSICVDPEGKENQEHHVEQVKHQQSTKVTGTVSSKCGETKMWRPVNRGNSHNISTNESAANSKPSNNSPNDNSGRIELKDDSNKNHDSGTGHDNCPFYPESSRYKQIIELLSQRWNEAVSGASGLEILSSRGSKPHTDDAQGQSNNPNMQCRSTSHHFSCKQTKGSAF